MSQMMLNVSTSRAQLTKRTEESVRIDHEDRNQRETEHEEEHGDGALTDIGSLHADAAAHE